jgi:hypothetical protein
VLHSLECGSLLPLSPLLRRKPSIGPKAAASYRTPKHTPPVTEGLPIFGIFSLRIKPFGAILLFYAVVPRWAEVLVRSAARPKGEAGRIVYFFSTGEVCPDDGRDAWLHLLGFRP